jgi:hypothetical protein
MPVNLTPAAWPLQSEAISFYGDPRKPGWLQQNTVDVACPWQLLVGKIPVTHITIHKKCAGSLTRVLAVIWEGAGKDQTAINKLKYDVYDGSYNLRLIRGGVGLSMHSFACAIDWDATDNPQHSGRHLFSDDSLLVKAFKAEGWIWGGDWSPASVDAMHVQAARIHP